MQGAEGPNSGLSASAPAYDRGAAPGSSLEFNAHGERAGWAHDVDAGSIVVVARRAVAGFVEGVLEIGQLSTPI